MDVLVIDDDAELGDYVGLALQTLGYRALTVTALPSPVPETRAALVDLMLAEPGAGLTAVRRLVEDRRVVVMTGLSGEHPTVQAALDAGAVAVLSKPCTLADIRACARRHLADDSA